MRHRRWILLVLCVVVAGIALAQEFPDVVVRPTGVTAPWKAIRADTGAPAVRICVFLDGADHLNPANYADCQDVGPDGTASGTTTSPLGAGNQVYRAVSLDADGDVSEPSPNTHTVIDAPFPAAFVSP